MDQSRQGLRVGRRDPTRDLDGLLHVALEEAMTGLSAVAGTIYLQDRGGDAMDAALVGGSPPAVFIMPERMLPGDPFASSRAWRSREVTVIGEPHASTKAVELGSDLVRIFPASHSVAATPIIDGERCYGALTLIRVPEHDGLLGESDCIRLRAIGDRLAGELMALEALGQCVLPGPRPAIFPVFEPAPPAGPTGASWGLPGLSGSASMTQMYQLQKFCQSLNRAVTPAEVAAVAERRFREPLGADAVVLITVAHDRLWVTGHAGATATVVGHVHGASATGNSPPARVFKAGEPQYFTSLSELHGNYPVPTPLDGHQAWALLPLYSTGHVMGVCCLGWSAPHAFRADEQALMLMMGELLGAAMERARLGAVEHAIAESVQTRLLPRRLPDLPELITTARYLPAPAAADSGVGGDWYDVIPLPNGGAGLVIGDVEGHALEAAGVMGQLRSAVRAYAAEGHRPNSVLARASRFLAEETELLATCCLVWLDPDAETATVALAGHPAPLIRSPGGRATVLGAPPGVPLGVPGEYQLAESPISPGSVIVLYTNGLSPARSGGDVVSEALRLLDLSSDVAADNPDGLADRMLAGVPGPPVRNDDAALLLARFEAARGAPHHRIAQMTIPQHDMRGAKTARKFVRDTLTMWDVRCDDAELVVSELITNGLVHAGSEVELRVRERPFGGIRLEVRDSDAAPPVPAPIACDEEMATAEHGRGLLIVAGLAESWGTSPSGRGKTVWVECAGRATS